MEIRAFCLTVTTSMTTEGFQTVSLSVKPSGGFSRMAEACRQWRSQDLTTGLAWDNVGGHTLLMENPLIN